MHGLDNQDNSTPLDSKAFCPNGSCIMMMPSRSIPCHYLVSLPVTTFVNSFQMPHQAVPTWSLNGIRETSAIHNLCLAVAVLPLPVSSHSYRWLKKHLAAQHSTWREQGVIAWLLHTLDLALIRKCQYLH